MATLDLENSDIESEYSDDFQLDDDLNLLNSSEDESKQAIVTQLQKSTGEQNSTCNKSPKLSKNNSTLSKSTKKYSSPKANENLNRTLRTPMKVDSSPLSSKGNASQADTSMSTTSSKKFECSSDVRVACYSNWLARKRSSISLEKSFKTISKEKEENQKKLKQKEKTERVAKTLEKWNQSKTEQIKKKQKQDREMAERKHLEEEDEELVKSNAKVVCEKWREDKTRDLVSKNKGQQRRKKEEVKNEEEEAKEKSKIANLAFNAWKSRKVDLIIQEKSKKQKEKQRLEDCNQQAAIKPEESNKAYDAWKSRKEEVIKTNKHNSPSKIHLQAWRPARAMKYDYPKDPSAVLNDGPSKSPIRTCSRQTSIDSYQSASFESCDNETSDSQSSLEDDIESSRNITTTGTRKAVQVCCQTLYYWCTCDDDPI